MPDTTEATVHEVVLFGASDDLIEVEGDLYDEVPLTPGGKATVGFSDGSLVSIEFADDGCWRIAPLIIGGDTTFSNEQAISEDGTDHATLRSTRPFQWMTVSEPDHVARKAKTR